MDYEEIKALKDNIFSSIHCALPGKIVSFDAESQTAVIQPAVKRRAEQRDGFDRSMSCRNYRTVPDVPLPLFHDVPVFMPVPFEIDPGDACLVIVADCDIDAWFESGEAEMPASNRMHSLSDGFAFVGFRPRVIPNEVEGSPSQGA